MTRVYVPEPRRELVGYPTMFRQVDSAADFLQAVAMVEVCAAPYWGAPQDPVPSMRWL